ncbi:MAG: biotin-dependent carboxyltransferase family protein [Cyclobacteriaceae bacterium]|nr:biotin-dependent carboxyltransferase family protein [Cyclobacteriaceae bacterium]
MAKVYLTAAGLLTILQDGGRTGYQRYGMPVSGAMDALSMRVANALLGNAPEAPVLEATLSGPSLVFEKDTCIAICGADMSPEIDGNEIPMYESIPVRAGDVLRLGNAAWGCRGYIAIAGGFIAPGLMASCATYLPAGIGGIQGRALKKGDILEYAEPSGKVIDRKLGKEWVDWLKREEPFLIFPGPELYRLTRDSIFQFLTNPYTLAAESNRMGYRLQGELIRFKKGAGADIISAGIPQGTIQVPGEGQPIVMMADRQTTGGYARMAVLAQGELSRAAQLKPGDEMRFGEARPEKAMELLKKERELVKLARSC